MTDDTEKSISADNIKGMEEKKQEKPRVFIEVIDSGPIKISGNIHINDMQSGREEFLQEVKLCRCGHSRNKPYCDESHKKF